MDQHGVSNPSYKKGWFLNQPLEILAKDFQGKVLRSDRCGDKIHWQDESYACWAS